MRTRGRHRAGFSRRARGGGGGGATFQRVHL